MDCTKHMVDGNEQHNCQLFQLIKFNIVSITHRFFGLFNCDRSIASSFKTLITKKLLFCCFPCREKVLLDIIFHYGCLIKYLRIYFEYFPLLKWFGSSTFCFHVYNTFSGTCDSLYLFCLDNLFLIIYI